MAPSLPEPSIFIREILFMAGIGAVQRKFNIFTLNFAIISRLSLPLKITSHYLKPVPKENIKSKEALSLLIHTALTSFLIMNWEKPYATLSTGKHSK